MTKFLNDPYSLTKTNTCFPCVSPACESLGLSSCPSSAHICYNASSGACARQAVCPSEQGDWLTCQDNRGCIHASQFCDNTVDCEDHSDENSCGDETPTSPPDVFFMCDNFKWVRSEKVCDGTDDCGDHSDEDGCIRVGLLFKKKSLMILILLSCS